MGSFNFHESFYTAALKHSAALKEVTEGQACTWLKELSLVFDTQAYCIIAAETATQILSELSAAEAMQSQGFRDDRVIFTDMLEQAASGQWQLVVLN